MKFKITQDKKFLMLTTVTQLELEQLEQSFTRKPDNWFIIKKKVPHWNGEIKLIDSYNRIPIGLWREVQKAAQKYHFPIFIEGVEELTDPSFNEDDFEEWQEDFFKDAYTEKGKKFTPRWYQIEGAKRVLKFRFCTEEISTSGGKTLIAYMIFRYLLDRKKLKKFLYVVPNVDLVTQSLEKFYEYEEMCKGEVKWKSEVIFSGAKKATSKVDITFGTWQSLSKRESNFYTDYNSVLIDECLHPDTLITMEDFSKKKISEINIGEKVWTYNEDINIFEIKEIEYVYKNLSINQQMYELEMENGLILKITGNHKVYTKEYGYVRVDELLGNEEIISINMMNK